jgi:NMD protein affecting ribosome stability and mRNA decay
LDTTADMPALGSKELCPDCQAEMAPIKLIDMGSMGLVGGNHRELHYAAGDAERRHWFESGTYTIEGVVRARMCTRCGRITLRGEPIPS